MEFDVIKLIDDIECLIKHIIRNEKMSSTSAISDLYTLAEFFEAISGHKINTDIFMSDKKMKEYVSRYYGNGVSILTNFINYNLADLNSLSNNLDLCVDKTTAIHLYNAYYNILQKTGFFSEKEFKDILYAFFSQYGDNALKSVKKMFDEKRIIMGAKIAKKADGYTAYSTITKGAYIAIENGLYGIDSLILLAHELGHAIHFYDMLIPNAKKKEYMSPYIEVPSCSFEMLFNDYLMRNHILKDGVLVQMNSKFATDLIAFNKYCGLLNTNDDGKIYINDDGEIDKDNDSNLSTYIGENIEGDLMYQIGYSIALHSLILYRDNPKEFIKRLNDAMYVSSSVDLKEFVNKMGIDYQDFISCDLIRPYIREKNDEFIQKQLKRHNL